MSTLEHLMAVTFTTSWWPSSLWKGPYSLKWDPNKAFSELKEKYLQHILPRLCDSKANDSKNVRITGLNIDLTGFILYWLVTHLITDANCSAWWMSFYVVQLVTQWGRLVGGGSEKRSSGHVHTSVLIQANNVKSLFTAGLLPVTVETAAEHHPYWLKYFNCSCLDCAIAFWKLIHVTVCAEWRLKAQTWL